VKSLGRVAGLVSGALPDLKLLLQQLTPTRLPIWTLGTRIRVHSELILEFRHSDLEPHRFELVTLRYKHIYIY